MLLDLLGLECVIVVVDLLHYMFAVVVYRCGLLVDWSRSVFRYAIIGCNGWSGCWLRIVEDK